MAYGRNFGSYANGGDAALASQIMQLTREREQRKWAADQQEQMRRQQVKDANAQAFDEAGRMPRESSPAFLATSDGRTGYIEDGAFIPSQVDALADRNRQLMKDYRMQGVQTRAAQKERENLQNVALCGMITSAQQNGGFVDPSMLGMVNQQLGDGTVKCIGGDTDGRGNLRIYGEAGNGQRGVMLTLSRRQQAALMGKTPGVEGGQAFVEKYLTDQIANGVSYEDAMRELGLDPGKMKSGASAAMRGERAASGGRASAQEKFDKEWFEHLKDQLDIAEKELLDPKFAEKSEKEQSDATSRRDRYKNMLEAYENNFAARYPTAKQQEENLKLQTNEAKAALAAQEKELRQINAALGKQAFDAAFQNGRLAGSGSWRGADGEEVLKYNGRRYAVGEAVDFGNGVMATWLGGGIEPENFEPVVEGQPKPAPAPGGEESGGAKSDAAGTQPDDAGEDKARAGSEGGRTALTDDEVAGIEELAASGLATQEEKDRKDESEARDRRTDEALAELSRETLVKRAKQDVQAKVTKAREREREKVRMKQETTAKELAGKSVMGEDLGRAAGVKAWSAEDIAAFEKERSELNQARNAAFRERMIELGRVAKDVGKTIWDILDYDGFKNYKID